MWVNPRESTQAGQPAWAADFVGQAFTC